MHVPSSGSIIESVDSISRAGLDTPICIIHYKNCNNSVQLKVGAYSRFLSNKPKRIHKDCHKCLNQIRQNVANCWSSFLSSFPGLTQDYTKAFISSFCMNQVNFIHQSSVTPLFHSDSKFFKWAISVHFVACSRMLSYSNNCVCSEGVCHVHYCDNHTQKMQ